MSQTNRDLQRLTEVRKLYRTGEAKQIRMAAAVSQAEFARAIGCGSTAVSLWESGQRSPKGELALRCWSTLTTLRSRQTKP